MRHIRRCSTFLLILALLIAHAVPAVCASSGEDATGGNQSQAATSPGPSPEILETYLGTGGWLEVGSHSVRTYATAGWRNTAEQAQAAALAGLPRIAALLGVKPEEVLPIWIVISPGGGRFAREAPSWSAAIARPQRHLIVLSGTGLERTRTNLEETVAHELAHLVIHTRIGDFGWMPLWIHEGLAVHLSRYRRLSDRLLFWGRGPIHLRELTDVFPADASRARLAYLESAAAVDRLLRLGSVAPLLDRIQAGEEFEEAFRALYGMTADAFANDVYEEVSRSWRYFTVLTSSVSLFGVLTLLFIIAGVRRKLRDRRRMQEWERVEREQEPGESV